MNELFKESVRTILTNWWHNKLMMIISKQSIQITLVPENQKKIHTCIHTCIHTHTHTYIHTYIHTYMHTYIHTYIRFLLYDTG